MRIVTVVGARPQFVKAAVVSRALAKIPGVNEMLVHTGQHFDRNMSDVFFSELEIRHPDYNLGIAGGRHGSQTGRMLAGIEELLIAERPDWVLVFGDTNSTLAGALAAAKLHIPIAHVEAGLRSFNRRMPEEVNRVLTDHVADLLLAPTAVAVDNLRKEGIAPNKVHMVGDVMLDAASYYGARAERTSRIMERLTIRPGDYVLATIHRAENTDDRASLSAILNGLANVAATTPVLLPLHPRTSAAIDREGLREVAARLTIIEPVGYLDMIMLERNAALIATDSGGVQKEAYFYGVPCVTLRRETEWVELIAAGWNRLAPPTSAAAVADVITAARGTTGDEGRLYGDGSAADAIVRLLVGEELGRMPLRNPDEVHNQERAAVAAVASE